MLMSYSVQQDAELSAEVHAEMDTCIDYYKRFPVDMVDFRANYTHDTPYIEKLKVTLYSKFPQQQDDHQFWNWLRVRLGLSSEPEFTPPKWPAVRTTAPLPQVHLPTTTVDLAEQQQLHPQQQHMMLLESSTLQNGSVSAVVATNATIPHLDLTLDSDQTPPSCGSVGSLSSNEQQTKEAVDKLLVRSLQEQLRLPSGLNMNPSPISSLPLLQPTTTSSATSGIPSTTAVATATASVSSNNSVQTSSSSPRDSPITIPSNSASPAKFEVPVRASPSPAKSDTTTSSSRTRNSPAPSPNRYHNQIPIASNVIHASGGGTQAIMGGSTGGGSSGLGQLMDNLPRSSPSLSVSSVSSQYGSSGKYENTMTQQHSVSSTAAATPQLNSDAAAAVAAQQQAQQISDYYSAANYASLTKNLSAFSPRDYALLFQSKDYGLASLNQLASLSGLGSNSAGAVGSSNSSIGSSSKQHQQQQQSGAGSSASVQNVAVAAAMAGNMKDFLAQLEKSTELSYLMQTANYNYPQTAQQQQQSTTQPMGTASASGGSGGTSSSRPSKSKRDKEARAAAAQQQQQMLAQQQQRQMEEEYKKDANKINEFMRSQEYATLLMEQAEAFGAVGGYGAALREPSAPVAPVPPPTKKSRKSQQHQQQQNQSAAAAAAAAAATAAALGDLTSLLQGSPKLHELSALFQTAKPGDLQALLHQQFATPVSSSSSSLSMPTSSISTVSSSKKQQQHQHQQHQLQQMQQLQDYNALFAHSKIGDLQSLMSSSMLSGLPTHSVGAVNQSINSLSNSSSSSSAAAAAAAVSSLLGVGGVGLHGTSTDLSALFSNALAGSGGVGSGSGLLGTDASALSASVDMLGSLLQQQQQSESDAAKSAVSDLSALFMSSQASAAGLHNLFANQPATSSASTSASSKAAAAAAAAASSYYTQAALDKVHLDMNALYQQHSQYAPASSQSSKPQSSCQSQMPPLPSPLPSGSSISSTIPDPLAKSTLASNNASMFMNPNVLYASMKMQQDALNAAMCMKPPQVSSSPSLSLGGSVSSPSNASLKSGRGDRDSNASPHQKSNSGSGNPNKYNFNAVDLAISSVPVSVPMSMDHMGGVGSGGPSEASAPKKRMEFSSIADLVAPPSKMKKLEEVAHGNEHHDFHAHHSTLQLDDDGSGGIGNISSAVLNLSSND